YGRPGATYLDIADDIIRGEVEPDKLDFPPKSAEPPRSMAMNEDITKALAVLQSAEKPLVIVGKGMAWSRAEDEVRAFIERTKLPFLASPMGKGVLDDNHPLSVGAARALSTKVRMGMVSIA
ncbi:MAG: oxalyl-CoA decarboxylase, partial [Aquincola sp.]|nr:oxalyl-CoA decarboxylase [Aquincola sp.]